MLYARVRTTAGIRYMCVTKQDGDRLTGYRVTKDGVRWGKQIDANTEQQEMIICRTGDVIEYLRMDNEYAELVKLR